MDDKKALKLLYGGFAILGGAAVGIWAFTANMFQIYECLEITLGGAVAGFGAAMVCHGIVTLIKK